MNLPRMPPLPAELLTLGRRVVRPRDAQETYSNPRAEFRRLARTGALRRVAHGYYLIPPQDAVAESTWRPPVEHLAMGIAVAEYDDRIALMGLSAARYHGAFPRAHATAWVAVEVTRRPLDCGPYGRVVFVRRDLARLDLVRARTPIADGWVTSVEQTITDLARRPEFAGGRDTALEAITSLWSRADLELVDTLAAGQRGRPALARVRVELGEALS